jgi:hypothetical protein
VGYGTTTNRGYQPVGGESADVLLFDGTTGVSELRLVANLADALSVEDTTGDLLVFDTTTSALALRPAADTFTANNTGITVGHTVQLTVGGTVPELQVLGTTTGVDGSLALVTASATNSAESMLKIAKGGNAALGSFTTVAQGENLGRIDWCGDDGVDLATVAARIGAVVNASGTVAASRVPTDLVFYTDPGGGDDAIAEQVRIGCGGVVFVNDTSHAAMTKGLCINQGAADDIALCLKSSDVATVLTTIVTGTVETDDYFTVSKFAAATGGVLLQALGENAAVTTNLRIESYGGQAETTHSSAGRSLIEVYAGQHDGANALSAVTADGNVFGIRCNQGGSEVTVWLVDEDGAPQSIVDHAAFADDRDDVALIRSLDHARAENMGVKGLVKSQWDGFVNSNEDQLVEIGVLGCRMPRTAEEPRPLLNMKRLAQLQNGALWQLFEDLMEVVAALPLEVQGRIGGRMRQRLEARTNPA